MATFGKLTEGTSTTGNATGRKFASKFAPTTSGTVKSGRVRCRCQYADSTISMRMLIYSDGTATTSALLAVSDETQWSSTTVIPIDFTFSGANQISITAGTDYYVGMFYASTHGNVYIYRDDETALTRSVNDPYEDGAANPWGNLYTVAGPMDAYITYDEPSLANTTNFFAMF